MSSFQSNVQFKNQSGSVNQLFPPDSTIIGEWERNKRKIVLYKLQDDQLASCLVDEKGQTTLFRTSQIKCGINGDATHAVMIQRINRFAPKKIQENIAVYVYLSEDKVEGVWVFEATLMAAPWIKTAKEKLSKIDFNTKEASALYSEQVKNFETALKLHAKQQGDIEELTSVIAQLKNNPIFTFRKKIEELLLQNRKLILNNLMSWEGGEKNCTSNASLKRIQEDFKKALESWEAFEPIDSLLAGNLGKIAIKQQNSFKKVIFSFLEDKNKKILCAEQALPLGFELYSWYYFITVSAIAENLGFSFETDDAQNSFSMTILGLKEGNSMELEIQTENNFIFKCLELLPFLSKGECEKFNDGLDSLAGTIGSQKELDGFHVLLQALAETPAHNALIPAQNLPLEVNLLKKIAHDDMIDHVMGCLEILIKSSPVKDLKGKQCFVLLEEGEAHWPSQVQFTYKPHTWFLGFLKPTLEKLSLTVCEPLIHSLLGEDATAELTIVLLSSKLDNLLNKKVPNSHDENADYFEKVLLMGLRRLEARENNKSLMSHSYMINIANNPTPVMFSGYQQLLMEDNLEDQYTILFKLVAKICQSSPESLQQAIDLFREGCRNLKEDPQITKVRSEFERLQQAIQASFKSSFQKK